MDEDLSKQTPFFRLNKLRHKAIDLSWTPSKHLGFCGQSCPCCRFIVEGPGGFGVCRVCQGTYDLMAQAAEDRKVNYQAVDRNS